MAAGLLALGAEMGVGCGGGPDGGICAARCDCEGCSEREYYECLDRAEADARSADQHRCSYEYDHLLACQNETYRCERDDHFETSCNVERDELERCDR